MEYEKLNSKAKGCMFLGTLVGIIIMYGIIVAICLGIRTELSEQYFIWPNLVMSVMGIIFLVYLIASPLVRYKRYRYCINEEKIDIIEGLIYIKRDIVPIERIHKITTQRGPIDRMFGLSKVIVTTAGGDVVIRFLEDDKAEKIAEDLKSTINTVVRAKGVN